MIRNLNRKFLVNRTLLKNNKSTATATSTVAQSHAAYIDLELEKSAHNYHPLPRVLSRGEGAYLWDVDGKV